MTIFRNVTTKKLIKIHENSTDYYNLELKTCFVPGMKKDVDYNFLSPSYCIPQHKICQTSLLSLDNDAWFEMDSRLPNVYAAMIIESNNPIYVLKDKRLFESGEVFRE
jgi:hypothetical protein